MGRHFYVYILASGKHGTIYIGVTNDLIRRVYEHKEKLVPGFTKDHHVDKLVYYEIFDDPEPAIVREKRLKRWKRDWKIELIERDNPSWDDLYSELI
ncbi:MAG: putative endonuclease [Hyphomicrobiales bacterium]|jgi:putative endonuclease|nr:putative endonuclease [Hyphomicrobiales bacterium]